jgi:hypothetical protein
MPYPRKAIPSFIALLFLLANGYSDAGSGTLYRWTDASGQVRYGYQPPPGIEAESAESAWNDQYGGDSQPACPTLVREHLQRIDQELERIRSLPDGLGPEYEFTPTVKQELLLDLLAHRAALVTGRRAEEFRAPARAQMREMKNRYEMQKRQMETELREQGNTIESQRATIRRKGAGYSRLLRAVTSATPWP